NASWSGPSLKGRTGRLSSCSSATGESAGAGGLSGGASWAATVRKPESASRAIPNQRTRDDMTGSPPSKLSARALCGGDSLSYYGRDPCKDQNLAGFRPNSEECEDSRDLVPLIIQSSSFANRGPPRPSRA